MIHTPLCDLLGIQYPVFQGGMAWIADGKLAAAVSEGGGLGILAAKATPRGLCPGADPHRQVPHPAPLRGEYHAHEPLRGGGGPGGGRGEGSRGHHRR